MLAGPSLILSLASNVGLVLLLIQVFSCRELKAAKEKLQRLQELVLRVQQGAGLDALMELESVVSAAESVDDGAAAPIKRFTYFYCLVVITWSGRHCCRTEAVTAPICSGRN